MIYLLIAIKAWQVCLGPVYDVLDGKLLGHALRMPERERLVLRASDNAAKVHVASGRLEGSNAPLNGWRTSRRVSSIVGAELACAIVVAWVVSTHRKCVLSR